MKIVQSVIFVTKVTKKMEIHANNVNQINTMTVKIILVNNAQLLQIVYNAKIKIPALNA